MECDHRHVLTIPSAGRRRFRSLLHPWYVYTTFLIESVWWLTKNTRAGYKVGAKKTVAELAQIDAEDESLARWKASLGIVPGAASTAQSGPQASERSLSQSSD